VSERFIKFIPSEEAFWLIHKKPNAFRLLTHIANTARRYEGHPDGLSIGQCHLQHWKKYNLTEREYRTAKEILVTRKHILICETNRTRKKSTTGTTTVSTLVKLLSSTVYDINSECNDDRIDDRATTDRRQTRKNKKEQEVVFVKETSKEKTQNEFAQIVVPLPLSKKSKEIHEFSLEQIQSIQAYLEHIDQSIPVPTIKRWLKSYGEERLIRNISYVLEKNQFRVFGASVEDSCKNDYAQQNDNIQINRKFASDFKARFNLFSLKIHKKYCVDENGNDYQYSLDVTQFRDTLERKFRKKL